jgi:opacity protein-like surface antigen
MKCALVSFVVFVALLLLLSDGASSQTKFAVGLRTGLNFASMSFDPDLFPNNPQIEQGGRTLFMIGAAGEYFFTPMFGVGLDLMYTGKGAKFTRSTDQASQTFKLSEIEFPILFKAKFLTGKIHPYGFVGPSIGIVTSASVVVEIPGQAVQDIDLKSNPGGTQVSGMDFSLQFGGGAEYMVAKQIGLSLDLRYVLGLSNLWDGSAIQQVPGAQTASQTWHTRGFIIQIGGLYYI